jgi:hypothetical protein
MSINCQCHHLGRCLHVLAPRPWFATPVCIVAYPRKDPRDVNECAVRYPFKTSDGHPLPPPDRVVNLSWQASRLQPSFYSGDTPRYL